MYVSRTFGVAPDEVGAYLRLLPLEGEGRAVVLRFEDLEGRRQTGFEVLEATKGPWQEAPRFAVYADWEVGAEGDPAGFEASRRALFALRRRTIASFHTDYLLRRLDDALKYAVLGLYGDEDGLTQSRGHPAIADWAKDNPPERWGARQVGPLRFFRVGRSLF